MKASILRAVSLVALAIPATMVAQTQLTGAGASFPFALYSKWFDTYHQAHPEIQINYQPSGSGTGIKQVTEGIVDFGATDGPMNDSLLKEFKTKRGHDVLHFPTTLGAVVPVYNIPGVTASLKFSGEALAGIFLGTVKKWNDPAIAKENPSVKLPAADIVVAHRSDGSGTTYVWTDYLSKVSPAWAQKVGKNTAVSWPVGLGGQSNAGVAGLVKQTEGAIGYVELIYAVQNKMSYGSVRNAAGEFVTADPASVSAAAASAVATMPDDFRVSITNASGKGVYSISSFTWLLIPAKIQDAAKKKVLVDFLKWMLADGQSMAEPLAYAKLPAQVIAKEQKAIAKVQ